MYDTWNPAELNEAVKNTSGSGNGLPPVDPTYEGKVLTVSNSGKWEAEDLPSSGYEIKAEETETNITYMGKKVYCSRFGFDRVTLGSVTPLFTAPSNIEIFDALMDSFDGNTHFISHPPTWISSGKVVVKAGYDSTAISGTMILYYTKVTTETKTTKKKTK